MSEGQSKIHQQMVIVWAKIPSIQRDGHNPHLNSNFTNIDSVIRALRPILTEAGLWLSQPTSVGETGTATVTTRICNDAGESVDLGTISVPWSSQKGLTNAQAFGSALTYARRYGLLSGLGLATGDDDDGGQQDDGPDPLVLRTEIQHAIGRLGFKDREEIGSVLNAVKKHLGITEAGDDVDALTRIKAFIDGKDQDSIMDFLNGGDA